MQAEGPSARLGGGSIKEATAPFHRLLHPIPDLLACMGWRSQTLGISKVIGHSLPWV